MRGKEPTLPHHPRTGMIMMIPRTLSYPCNGHPQCPSPVGISDGPGRPSVHSRPATRRDSLGSGKRVISQEHPPVGGCSKKNALRATCSTKLTYTPPIFDILENTLLCWHQNNRYRPNFSSLSLLHSYLVTSPCVTVSSVVRHSIPLSPVALQYVNTHCDVFNWLLISLLAYIIKSWTSYTFGFNRDFRLSEREGTSQRLSGPELSGPPHFNGTISCQMLCTSVQALVGQIPQVVSNAKIQGVSVYTL